MFRDFQKMFQNPKALPYIFYGFFKCPENPRVLTPLHFLQVFENVPKSKVQIQGNSLTLHAIFWKCPKILGYPLHFLRFTKNVSKPLPEISKIGFKGIFRGKPADLQGKARRRRRFFLDFGGSGGRSPPEKFEVLRIPPLRNPWKVSEGGGYP